MKLSRPESVLFAGVLLVVACFSAWAGLSARDLWLQRKIRQDFRSMEIAIYDYREKNKELPVRDVRQDDIRFGPPTAPNRGLCEILLGGPGKGGGLNRDHLRYLRVNASGYRRSGINGEGDWVDPWAVPYQVILDVDANSVCDIPGTRFGSAIGVSVAMWSYGPDRIPETPDDIISWK